ncbi:MAG: hypothetical protein HN509_10160 [Halobacteriovoraceae bacterium]|jgi:hypothetical protein|nr:hypothetical protein [Halobacteriovoraceae bacterium]MBT5093512.1 hypothetical protein [Halobacteriovoraceae bacterium]
MKLLLICLLFTLQFAQASEIDEKMVGRILAASDSKQTLLVNKGIEHGLKVGDHAKFSTPLGTFCRGVVVKVSPSRSVWSVYRFLTKATIKNNLAATIKISTPLKLTTDETRHLGAFADAYKKQTGEKIQITRKEDGIKKSMERTEIIISKYDSNIDFSTIEDAMKVKKRDTELDWKGVDGLKDQDKLNSHLDYSALR